jgi:hypothetical protein
MLEPPWGFEAPDYALRVASREFTVYPPRLTRVHRRADGSIGRPVPRLLDWLLSL